MILGAVAKGACTDVVAQQLFESLSKPGPFALAAKARRELEKKAKGACFVEFCCASYSQLRRVAKSFGIEYLGLSLDFVDLSDPDAFAQVEAWAVDRAEAGVVIHLLGSLPCTPWVSWQHLNLAKQGEEFRACVEKAREESLVLVEHFTRLAEVAVCSGGSASFEWPKYCAGWVQQPVLDMISQFDMKMSHPTGCGFRLCIDGKWPLKQWCVVSTHARLTVELDRRCCRHDKGHKHDQLTGDVAWKSGFYNRAMATVILGALFPKEVHDHVPACPVVAIPEGPEQHAERDVPFPAELTEVTAMVTKALTRKEMLESAPALEAVAKEGEKMRAKEVWDDATAIEVDVLCRQAREKGEKIHIADAMAIAGIKNSELPPDKHVHKGRVVYRGDITKDEQGSPALFRELQSLPTNIQAINLTIFLGMISGWLVQAAALVRPFYRRHSVHPFLRG